MSQRDQILRTVIRRVPGLNAKQMHTEDMIDFEPSGYLTPLVKKGKLSRVQAEGTWRYFPKNWEPEHIGHCTFGTARARTEHIQKAMIDFVQSGKYLTVLHAWRERKKGDQETPSESLPVVPLDPGPTGAELNEMDRAADVARELPEQPPLPVDELTEDEFNQRADDERLTADVEMLDESNAPEGTEAATDEQQEPVVELDEGDIAQAVKEAEMPPEVIARVCQVEKLLEKRIEQLTAKNEELTETHLNLQTELELLTKLQSKQDKAEELWQNQKELQREIKEMTEQIKSLRVNLLRSSDKGPIILDDGQEGCTQLGAS